MDHSQAWPWSWTHSEPADVSRTLWAVQAVGAARRYGRIRMRCIWLTAEHPVGLVLLGVAVFARWAGPNSPGYALATPTDVVVYECGGVDVPEMTPDASLRGPLIRVGSVTICHHPRAAGFATWTNVDAAGNGAGGDGPAVSQTQVQALLDALAPPPAIARRLAVRVRQIVP